MSNTLLLKDVEAVIDALPEPVLDILQKNPNCFLAGGFIRAIVDGTHASDIDIYVPNKSVALTLAAKVLAASGKFKDTEPIQTEIAITCVTGYMKPVQFIFKYEDSPYNVIEQFDFTNSGAALWFVKVTSNLGVGVEPTSAVTRGFYKGCKTKELRCIHSVEEPLKSFKRMLKFSKLGYSVPDETSAAVLVSIVGGFNSGSIPSILEGLAKCHGDSGGVRENG